MSTSWITMGALLGFAAVGLGAFGAHGLEDVASPKELEWWSTAAHYHLTHALVLVGCGLLAAQRPGAKAVRGAAVAFTVGIALFSGSLYAMALGAPRWLGALTPLGGLALMLGWLFLARAGRGTDEA